MYLAICAPREHAKQLERRWSLCNYSWGAWIGGSCFNQRADYMRMGMFASCRDIRMGGVMSKFAARTSVACAAALQRRAGLHPAVSRGKRVRIPPRHMDRRVLILPSCKASGFAFHCVVLTSRFASYNAVRQASLRTATPHGQASSHPATLHGKQVCILPLHTDKQVFIPPCPPITSTHSAPTCAARLS